MRQYRNCKLDNVCTNLEHLFLCENGLCQNITSAFDCHYTKSQHPVDCKDKRQCITLNGLYECHDGQCAKVIGHCGCFLEFLSKKYFREISILGKVENILKGIPVSVPSYSPSVKIQIMFGKSCLRCKGNTLLVV